jgi:hypothetical protein
MKNFMAIYIDVMISRSPKSLQSYMAATCAQDRIAKIQPGRIAPRLLIAHLCEGIGRTEVYHRKVIHFTLARLIRFLAEQIRGVSGQRDILDIMGAMASIVDIIYGAPAPFRLGETKAGVFHEHVVEAVAHFREQAAMVSVPEPLIRTILLSLENREVDHGEWKKAADEVLKHRHTDAAWEGGQKRLVRYGLRKKKETSSK